MSHGLGVTEALRALPDAVVLLFGIVTQLGDVWFYFLALALAYAYGPALPRFEDVIDRRRGAFLVAVALGVAAFTELLKATVGHPRPAGAAAPPAIGWLPAILDPLVAELVTADGFTFPSGHATSSAAIYGAAALVVEYGSRRDRLLTASGIVGLVALSRVVIGVHYLLDVVAGVVAGTVYLAAAYGLSDRGTVPTQALVLGFVVALVGVGVHVSEDTLSALGAVVGGLAVWLVVRERVTGAVTRREGDLAAAVGIVGGGLFVGIGYAAESLVVSFLGPAIGVAAVLGGPVVARKVLDETEE